LADGASIIAFQMAWSWSGFLGLPFLGNGSQFTSSIGVPFWICRCGWGTTKNPAISSRQTWEFQFLWMGQRNPAPVENGG